MNFGDPQFMETSNQHGSTVLQHLMVICDMFLFLLDRFKIEDECRASKSSRPCCMRHEVSRRLDMVKTTHIRMHGCTCMHVFASLHVYTDDHTWKIKDTYACIMLDELLSWTTKNSKNASSISNGDPRSSSNAIVWGKGFPELSVFR